MVQTQIPLMEDHFLFKHHLVISEERRAKLFWRWYEEVYRRTEWAYKPALEADYQFRLWLEKAQQIKLCEYYERMKPMRYRLWYKDPEAFTMFVLKWM